MATWNRLVNSSSAGNVKLNIDYAVTNVNRSGNTVTFNYGVRFSMATSTYTYNNIAAFCPSGGTRYTAFNSGSGSRHTTKGTYYYANTSGATTTSETTPFYFSQTVSSSATSLTFAVGFGWNAWSPSQKGSANITVSFPAAPPPEPEPTPDPEPTPPSASLSLSSVSNNSITLRYSSNSSSISQMRIYLDGSLWDTRSASSSGYFTIGGLGPKTSHSVRVQLYGYDVGLWSSNSNTVYATTAPDPVWVTYAYVSDIQPYSAKVSITSSSAGDTSQYGFTLCNSSGTTIKSEVRQSGSTYTFTGLNEDTSYIVKTRVYTKTSGDSSSYYNVSFQTLSDQVRCWIKNNYVWQRGRLWIKSGDAWVKARNCYINNNGDWRINNDDE